MPRKKGEPLTSKRKAERHVSQARLDEVIQLRLDGAKRWDVRQYVSEREKEEEPNAWTLNPGEQPMSESNVNKYIVRADEAIMESTVMKRKDRIRRAFARREHAYAKAMMAGDIATALAALKDEANLAGLYPPKKTANADSKGRDKPPEAGALEIIAAIVAAQERTREGREPLRLDAEADEGGG